MSNNPSGVPDQEIAPSEAVDPAGMNPEAGGSLPPADAVAEAKSQIKKLEAQFNELRSKKDREVEAERQARQNLEQQYAGLQSALQQEQQARFSEWEKHAEPDEVQKARQQYADQQRQSLEYRARVEAWNAWRYRQAVEHGLTKEEVESIRSPEEMAALIARKQAVKDSQASEAAIEERVVKKLREQGLLNAQPQTKPRTPLDSSAAAGGSNRVSLGDIDKAEAAFLKRPRDSKLKAEFERLTMQYAEQNKD